jgi:hypothetical protein
MLKIFIQSPYFPSEASSPERLRIFPQTAGRWRLRPIILAMWEAESRGITV